MAVTHPIYRSLAWMQQLVQVWTVVDDRYWIQDLKMQKNTSSKRVFLVFGKKIIDVLHFDFPQRDFAQKPLTRGF